MTENVVIDAAGFPAGRISSYAANEAILGKEVAVINSEKAVISGNKEDTIAKYKRLRRMGGDALKGPYHSLDAEKRLKRMIRSMLPDYKTGRGREAWKRVRCYIGVPAELKSLKPIKLNLRTPAKHITLKELKEKL